MAILLWKANYYYLNKMKGKYNFKLINGKFATSEASRILFDLIRSKINYHTMENFSNQERFGKDMPHSERRIKALKKALGSLEKVCELAKEKGLKLRIDGSVDITIIE